jgi:hypothetical protein
LAHEEFISEYSDRDVPVVISGAIDHWSARDLFSLDYFERRFEDRTVRWPGQEPLQVGPLMRRIRDSSADNPAPYLQEVSIYDHFPEILDAVTPMPPYPFPDWASTSLVPRRMHFSMRAFELLIGGPGSQFRTLHQDTWHVHAFIFQIVGKKTFYLFSPENTPFLYADREHPNVSPIDPFAEPDLERYPRFAQARGVEVTVNEGELIFVPADWWHTTRLDEVSIAVTINWVHRSNWDRYSVSMSQGSVSPWKRRLKRNYFKQLGRIMPVLERSGADRRLAFDRHLRQPRDDIHRSH